MLHKNCQFAVCVREDFVRNQAEGNSVPIDLLGNLMQLFFQEPRRREASEEKLELPKSLIAYLQSPRVPGLEVIPKLDFNTIVTNCCPPEENCSCHYWIEITLQGLY